MRSALFAVLIIFVAFIIAHAQNPVVVSYNQQIFAPGVSVVTGTPLQTNTYLAGAALCNQVAPIVPAVVTNPTRFFFDDAANAGKVCIAPLVSTLLPALPNGVGYASTITQVDNLGQESDRSAASNFFGKQGKPTAPTGYKVSGP